MIAIKQRASRGQVREAFTLVELMVVIAILGVLAALTAGAVVLYMETQRGKNTKTYLGKINTGLNKQYQTVLDRARNPQTPIPAAILNMAGTDGNAKERARVIYAKALLKQTFPMSFAEVFNPAPLAPLPAYVTKLNVLGITTGNNPPLNFESSACLLMALQRSDGGAGAAAEDIGGGGASAEFPLGNGQTIKALTDGWGNPLQFTRWPTGSQQLNPGGPQTGFNDPLDPQGLLNFAGWQNANTPGSNPAQTNLTTFAGFFHPLGTGNLSYRLTPMVISVGPDGTLYSSVP